MTPAEREATPAEAPDKGTRARDEKTEPASESGVAADSVGSVPESGNEPGSGGGAGSATGGGPGAESDSGPDADSDSGPGAEPASGHAEPASGSGERLDVFAELGVAPGHAQQSRAQGTPASIDLDIPEREDDQRRGQAKDRREAATAGVQEADRAEEAQTEHAEQTENDDAAAAHDAQSDQGETGDAASGTDDSPRLPATALLFQAPEPTPVRRRRRAGAPVGPPVVSDDSASDTDETGPAQGEQRPARGKKESGPKTENGSRGGDGPASGGDEQSDDGSGSSDDEGDGQQARRRRRRRGGRGRKRGGGSRSPQQADQDTNGSDSANGSESADRPGRTGKTKADDAQQPSDGTSDSPGSADSGPGQRQQKSKGDGKDAVQNGGKGQNGDKGSDKGSDKSEDKDSDSDNGGGGGQSSARRRRRRNRGSRGSGSSEEAGRDEVTALKGSTRLEAKRQRRRDGRDSGRRRSIITEAEFLARRESVNRDMVVRERNGRTQVAVLEDEVLVEHYVARKSQTSMVGNVHLGRVQNVLPSMEAAFIDIGKGRNAVLYAGEVNWDAAGLEGQPRRIEQALAPGDTVLVQVTKDPVGHKGARLTSQITLAGRYLVLVPSGAMTGISRKLPDTERNRLKKLLKEIVPDGQGVIVRTAAEGAKEEELRRDVERLTKQWADIEKKSNRKSVNAPTLLKGEPELAVRVVRDVFNEDFNSLTISGDEAWKTISEYVEAVAPDLRSRVHHWTDSKDLFSELRIDEQIAKALERKVWLPSGGSLVIDRTEAMTVVDVNTGKFTGSGGTLEETVTRNNLEAAEEIVRQLRLRDIGGIIVIDFIDMVLEANRDLVLRRLVECLGRDRTRHQVAEVTSLGLVQMTRKRIGQGLFEAFSEDCEHCNGRGYHMHSEPLEVEERSRRGGKGKGSKQNDAEQDEAQRAHVRAALANIAAASANAHTESEAKEDSATEESEANGSSATGEAAPNGGDRSDGGEKHGARGNPDGAGRPDGGGGEQDDGGSTPDADDEADAGGADDQKPAEADVPDETEATASSVPPEDVSAAGVSPSAGGSSSLAFESPDGGPNPTS